VLCFTLHRSQLGCDPEYVCIRGGSIGPLHRDPQWSIVLVILSKIRPTVRSAMLNTTYQKGAAAGACTNRELGNFPVTVCFGNRRQSHLNPSKALPLTIRVYYMVTSGFGSGGQFSFMVCQKSSRISSELTAPFTTKGLKYVSLFQLLRRQHNTVSRELQSGEACTILTQL
jgi:hypothetical protein